MSSSPYVIDCDADPFVPKDWKVEDHRPGGQFEWDPAKVKLYLSDEQRDGKTIQGHKLREDLKDKPVLNANVLEYLLENPMLIPDEWKGKYIFFWGTIYRNSGGNLVVRCLLWNGDRWDWYYLWLDVDFSISPAAVSVNN